MDKATQPVPFRIHRLLPYWAVLKTDISQTLHSWVYRLWVLMMILAAGGYVLFKLGAARAGEYEPAAVQTDDLLRALALGSLSLIALLAVSSISGERGVVADSVLSRGISRYQYYFAKWHARLLVILSTFVILSVGVILAYTLLFTEAVQGSGSNVTLPGSIAGLILLAAVLGVVVTWGVAIGAVSAGTVLGITFFWILIFGSLFIVSRLPADYPNLNWMMNGLRNVLRGGYQSADVLKFVAGSVVLSLIGTGLGMFHFVRRDV